MRLLICNWPRPRLLLVRLSLPPPPLLQFISKFCFPFVFVLILFRTAKVKYGEEIARLELAMLFLNKAADLSKANPDFLPLIKVCDLPLAISLQNNQKSTHRATSGTTSNFDSAPSRCQQG